MHGSVRFSNSCMMSQTTQNALVANDINQLLDLYCEGVASKIWLQYIQYETVGHCLNPLSLLTCGRRWTVIHSH